MENVWRQVRPLSRSDGAWRTCAAFVFVAALTVTPASAQEGPLLIPPTAPAPRSSAPARLAPDPISNTPFQADSPAGAKSSSAPLRFPTLPDRFVPRDPDDRTPRRPVSGRPDDPFGPIPLSPDAAAARYVGRLFQSIPEDDYTAASLRRVQDDLRRRFGIVATGAEPIRSDRDMPLVVKAEYLERVLAKYHLSRHNVAYHTVALPEQPGSVPEPTFGDDVSTWHGTVLAGLSYKYAVTRDRETLATIVRLADGLHFLQAVTGARGLVARCVLPGDQPVHKCVRPYLAPSGERFHYLSDAAKGTYNQVVIGYATMLLLVGDDLPEPTRRQAAFDLTEMVIHLIDHKWKITEADGKHTEYGDLTPLYGPVSVPFNGQLAYMMTAAAHTLPGGDPIQVKMIRREFERLRERHHVYYEDPRINPVPPQKIGGSPLVKGMNDRNHVANAAYVGILLELDSTRRQQRPFDPRFVYELGQTIAWTIQEIEPERNALCNFMWAGLLGDPAVLQAIVPRASQEAALRQRQRLVADGLEQLARSPIDRFYHQGKKVETREPQWIDAQRPDESYRWKSGAYSRWEITGPPNNLLTFGSDYLHAYWLMRYYALDSAPPVPGP